MKAKIIHKNEQLSGKVIYVVSTGAHKIYQIEEIVRKLKEKNAKIYLFLTYPAEQMIGQEAIARLSKICEIRRDFSWYQKNPPIDEEDLVLVCPCTFNSLIKISYGLSDDYALTIVSAAISKKKKVLVAPAFNELWYHPATKPAIDKLLSWKTKIIWPNISKQKVTMMDVDKILDYTYGELQKIKYDSLQITSKEIVAKLETVRKKYLKQFQLIGKSQHLKGTNSDKHGCYSVKIDDEWMLITASGAKLNKLLAKDLTLVKINDDKIINWCGDLKPSSETPIHIGFYMHSNNRAVIHSHNPKITYSSKFDSFNSDQYIPYGIFNNNKIIVNQALKQGGFIILKYHGEIATASSLKAAHNLLHCFSEK